MSHHETRWEFTNLFDAARRSGNLPEVNVGGRHLICRDSPINGGFSASDGEPDWIIVDEQQDTDLQLVFRELLKRIKDSGRGSKDSALEEAYKLVQEKIPYDKRTYEKIIAEVGTDVKLMSLSRFFSGGVCRYQALLGAYLIEELINRGILGGQVSFDSNTVGVIGGHSWVRYTTPDGTVFIMDTALKYVGELARVIGDGEKWAYGRPDDIEKRRRELSAGTLATNYPIAEIQGGHKQPGLFQKLSKMFAGR